MDLILSGTKVYGNQGLSLRDALVPKQLWVVTPNELIGSQIYTIENAKGGTFLELSMLVLSGQSSLRAKCRQYYS